MSLDLEKLTDDVLANADSLSSTKSASYPSFVVNSFHHIVYVVKELSGTTDILVSYVNHRDFMRSFREGEIFGTQELSSGNVSGIIDRVVNSIRVRGTLYIDVTVYYLR